MKKYKKYYTDSKNYLIEILNVENGKIQFQLHSFWDKCITVGLAMTEEKFEEYYSGEENCDHYHIYDLNGQDRRVYKYVLGGE